MSVYVMSSIPAKVDTEFTSPDLELLWVRLQLEKCGSSLLAGCMYRPPSADKSFWKKVEATLESAEREEIVLLGDLNGDFLQPSSANFSHLKEALLLPLSLSNLIAQPTRFAKNSHTSLDVVLTNCDKVHPGFVKDFTLSDHCLVHDGCFSGVRQPIIQ